ncbi:hypothetical protein MKW94_029358 [Papaver nudicaule]|uniref:non-specific serine/threonine protein kinase n=1 Tax=Papaver nudicaule TaxID=74823 RepID=A0AA41S2N5_PAPNU|nr:hypothetical protein [Papaver nudicaule]
MESATVGRGKFKVGRKIGNGAFGDIYIGTNAQTNEEVAIKVEYRKVKHPQLLYESKIYAQLQGGKGIPRLMWFGVEGEYNVMVIDLLGKSLEDLLSDCGGKFTLKTVLMLADQLIDRVEYIHSRGLVHRDIKPQNLMVGVGRRENLVYMIDYGLARKYKDMRTHEHVPYRDNRDLVGTVRYASVNSHLGVEQSRRDDLETLGYMLVYFLKGRLPWQGLQVTTRKMQREKIRDMKMSTPIEVLCDSCPSEFVSYFRDCRSLRFDDKPDYAYLKRLFRDLFIREKYQFDNVYDWDPEKRTGPTTSEHGDGKSRQVLSNSSSGAIQQTETGLNPSKSTSFTPITNGRRDIGDDTIRSFQRMTISTERREKVCSYKTKYAHIKSPISRRIACFF